ncbi:Uncharacterised protein [Mycobacteroides abscessus subsp. abscessus]|uniref:hypothetical protein n=1 Tax=Mycobacteroides abscessus TaxID=36809 RepID=UPI00092C6409|nr:hypothetical protein [Mycobacteroides abscessus]MEC4838161.1 hypothetical protein [Mycobacteroides chelonae]WJJ55618.1 hypothetical protein PROPHIT362_27 [Mycobacterium phage prophiT36-2a]MDB2211764.1 hypothetical protein [Mycobacteroides abscessus subsp. massiliense]MDB2235386.1 hypothetical protein [Mycobacteroides abscessus subsp. massiliense]MDM2382262.1 hypothetical protein [Mycobacteroides abscessus]
MTTETVQWRKCVYQLRSCQIWTSAGHVLGHTQAFVGPRDEDGSPTLINHPAPICPSCLALDPEPLPADADLACMPEPPRNGNGAFVSKIEHPRKKADPPCCCHSIIKDEHGRLQCLTHGDVTDRRGDPSIADVRLDGYKRWSYRN